MKGFKLFLIAVILSVILFPLGILFSWIFNRKKFDTMLHRCAVAIDQSGNVFCSDLFDYFLLTKDENRYKFGSPDETISGVLGKNFLRKSLSPVGIWLYNLLEKIEPNHSINAIEVDETYEVKVEGKTVYKEEKHTEIDLNP